MAIDIIKKALLTGIGLALRTKDELEELAKDYVNKGDLSENEGKKFLDDLTKRYDDAKEKLDEKIETSVKKILDKADIATKEEVNELKSEITLLKDSIKKSDESE
jgi:polyhydroxyalkanoate synthesis regulator phasin